MAGLFDENGKAIATTDERKKTNHEELLSIFHSPGPSIGPYRSIANETPEDDIRKSLWDNPIPNGPLRGYAPTEKRKK